MSGFETFKRPRKTPVPKPVRTLHYDLQVLARNSRQRAEATTPRTTAYTEHSSEAAAYTDAVRMIESHYPTLKGVQHV